MGGKQWKYLNWWYRMHPNGYGDYFESGSSNDLALGIDFQNQHMTAADAIHGDATDKYAKPEFYSISRYALPTGLLEIMQ